MHFEIDTVTEFTYFQNLLLGLATALRKCVGVKRTYLKKTNALTDSEITEWEKTQNIVLPEDLRLFYSSSDGCFFEWTYTVSDPENVIGKIEINPLQKLERSYGYETTCDCGITIKNNKLVLRLSLESKLFKIETISNFARVVLVYLYPDYESSIWLQVNSIEFYFLAENVTKYLRMSIAHLGIPLWQLAYTPQGIPQWTENIFRMLIPNSIPLGQITLGKMIKEKHRRLDHHYADVPVNTINPEIFKTLTDQTPIGLPKPLLPIPSLLEQEKSKVVKKKQITIGQIKHNCNVRYVKRKPLYYIRKR